MSALFRVGTRRSPLARAQTRWVLARLSRAAPGSRFRAVHVDTSGDRDRSPGSSPDFTDTIDRALARGEVDLAVHSAKDLPARLGRPFEVVAYPRRADPRDCLVVVPRRPLPVLPRGARVGSSSPRRRAQLLRWRPDLRLVEIRGNVDTRIGLVRAGRIDAAILAAAGLARLGRITEVGRILPTASFLPAPGQGALAVVARADERDVAAIAHRVDHPATNVCVTAERAFAAALGSDCRLPLGALATVRGGRLLLVGEVLAPDGRVSLRRELRGAISKPEALGAKLGRGMLDQGALDLMSPRRR